MRFIGLNSMHLKNVCVFMIAQKQQRLTNSTLTNYINLKNNNKKNYKCIDMRYECLLKKLKQFVRCWVVFI